MKLAFAIALISSGLFSLTITQKAFAQGYSQDPNSVNYAPVIARNNVGDFDLSSLNATAPGAGVGNTGAAQGSEGQTTYRTNEAPAQARYGNSAATGPQRTVGLPTTYTSLDKVFGGGQPLPPTSLDSFVLNAAGSADQIYGDEGTTSIPPFFEFTEDHTIGAGINSGGLTTGHASALPSAWGYPN